MKSAEPPTAIPEVPQTPPSPTIERSRTNISNEDIGKKSKRKPHKPLATIGDKLKSSVGADVESWKEFRKGLYVSNQIVPPLKSPFAGTYTYPISFAVPSGLPPTMYLPRASVSYRLWPLFTGLAPLHQDFRKSRKL